jgi:hypothetical protein
MHHLFRVKRQVRAPRLLRRPDKEKPDSAQTLDHGVGLELIKHRSATRTAFTGPTSGRAWLSGSFLGGPRRSEAAGLDHNREVRAIWRPVSSVPQSGAGHPAALVTAEGREDVCWIDIASNSQSWPLCLYCPAFEERDARIDFRPTVLTVHLGNRGACRCVRTQLRLLRFGFEPAVSSRS